MTPTLVTSPVPTLLADGGLGPNDAAPALPRSILTIAPAAIVIAAQTALPSATAPLATSTVTATPTLLTKPPHVAAIQPAIFMNDQPTRVSVTGDGFVDTGYTVRIGERALSDVRVESSTALTGTLPPGVCPGVYAATITDALGHQVTGGLIQAQGALSATSLGHDIAAPAIQLVGRVQRVRVVLPTVQIRDTTCSTGNVHLVVSVSEFAQSEGRPSRLVPLSILAEANAAGPGQPLTLGHGRATATLLIQRPNSTALANVVLSSEIEIPSHPAAGDYRATVTVTLVEGNS